MPESAACSAHLRYSTAAILCCLSCVIWAKSYSTTTVKRPHTGSLVSSSLTHHLSRHRFGSRSSLYRWQKCRDQDNSSPWEKCSFQTLAGYSTHCWHHCTAPACTGRKQRRCWGTPQSVAWHCCSTGPQSPRLHHQSPSTFRFWQ